MIGFGFDEENKLRFGEYIFTEKHADFNLYIDDYYKIMNILKKEFPNLDLRLYWNNKLYQDDESKHGISLSLGYHSYVYHIPTDSTMIRGILNCVNAEALHHILFTDKSYQKPSKILHSAH